MSNPTDEELDRDWKPSGRRPQSTIARSFSQELGDIFRIENSVADLNDQVDKRKQHVLVQTSELEALEARIREMEAVLKNPKRSSLALMSPGSSFGSARPSLNSIFPDSSADAAQQKENEQQQQQQQQDQKYGSRPGTARASQQAVPGALPPTPVGSEGG